MRMHVLYSEVVLLIKLTQHNNTMIVTIVKECAEVILGQFSH